MIRINKNLAVFSSLIFLLGIFSLLSLQKLSPIISHTVYYCQSFINSLSLPIPYYLGAIPFVFVFIVLLIAVLRLSTIYIKVQFLRKNLIRKIKSNTSFNMLLEKLQLADKTYFIESEKRFAFCLGVRSPKIYVSTGLLSCLTTEELEVVLRHERYHLKNKDTLTMLIASIGESLLPFFPIFSDFLANFRIEREIKADKDAIQGLGNKEPVISVLKKLLSVSSMTLITASAIADRDTLEPRILALVKKDFHFRRFKMRRILVSVASVLLMSVIILAPVQAVEVNQVGENVMMICPQGNECLIACKQEYSVDRKNYSENIMYTPIDE